jgi:hypothetical protein
VNICSVDWLLNLLLDMVELKEKLTFGAVEDRIFRCKIENEQRIEENYINGSLIFCTSTNR